MDRQDGVHIGEDLELGRLRAPRRSAPLATRARRTQRPGVASVFKVMFIRSVLDDDLVSGITDLGTTPCLVNRLTIMSHCPPSSRTLRHQERDQSVVGLLVGRLR